MKKIISVIFILVILGFGGYYFASARFFEKPLAYKTLGEADPFVRFSMEAYDLILQNYWDEHKNYNLATIFKMSLEKASGKTQNLSSTTREAISQMFVDALAQATSTEEKKNLVVNTLIIASYNLQPVGRNGLLSTAQEKQLRETVANVNPAKNLYDDLGLSKGASIEDVSKASALKEKELKASTSSEAKVKLEQVTYAKKVLTNPDTKMLYDQNQIEPTLWSQKIGKTLYIYMSKISPSSLFEFAKAIENASTTPNLDSMILDFRGNLGGALDFAQHFTGLFIGLNQFSFDLYSQGKYDPQRTVQPEYPLLDRYKEIAILTDNMTQSTAEVISSSFKRMNLAKTIGTNTRGWGTVENTYPITTEIDSETKYSLLLVNSITLRDDNQPIEGRGVDPNISITDTKWKSKLPTVFRSTSLIKALETTVGNPPLK